MKAAERKVLERVAAGERVRTSKALRTLELRGYVRTEPGSGRAEITHAGRLAIAPGVAEVASKPTYQPGQKALYESRPAGTSGASDVAVEDARRYLRHLTFGIEPTDDPREIIENLLSDPEVVYSQDEVDEIKSEHESDLKSARDEAAEHERELALVRGHLEAAERARDEALAAFDESARDAIEARDRALELERRLAAVETWRTGLPEESGYYLAAWSRAYAEGTSRMFVSELWFNRLDNPPRSSWWTARGYLDNTRGREISTVVAWMRKPEAP